jgi:uncharacterized protein with NAD-binding domain and iron-sulfur cluster
MKRRDRVIVVGGGVAGLTAAHELVERGFEVQLFDRREWLGGKAASITLPEDDPEGRGGLPGEHGFRFFPGWYRHLPHTMSRIPYRGRTVADNLIAADLDLLATYHRDPVLALLRMPTSWKEVQTAAAAPSELFRLGLTTEDFQFFFGKLWEFLISSEERRVRDYDTMTWWNFLEADTRSQAFRDYFVTAATRSTVAARPTEASAYTIARMAIQTLMDTVSPTTSFSRVLNGPTNEVWIDPWVEFLEQQGVVIHRNAELSSIEFDGTRREIVGLRFDFEQGEMRALRQALAAREGQGLEGADLLRHYGLEGASREDIEERYETKARDLRAQNAEIYRADYYVFALPVEQMAYHVQRSATLRALDPSLTNLILLSEHVDWMAGIQFFFTRKLEINRGHIACLDSEWQITAIEQAQFWGDEIDIEGRNRGKVKSVLSVDISAWNTRGRVVGKEAYNCSPEEIAEEVWGQLDASLNRPGKPPAFRREWLLGWKQGDTFPKRSYYIDDSICERFDRKKQAVYDKSSSVRFQASELVRRQSKKGNSTLVPLSFGRRRLLNAEPLLINRVGSQRLRPHAKTTVRNMFLAADYVRTHTDLATMEGANEAARVAVNEILLDSGVRAEPCSIWPLREPLELLREVDKSLFRRKLRLEVRQTDIPMRLAGGAAIRATKFMADVMTKVAERTMKK